MEAIMGTGKRWMIASVSCVILVGAVIASAQNWPQWRGPNRDGKVTGFTAPQKWPATLTQKWKVSVGQGDASPALVDQQIYVFVRQGTKEALLCLSAADGKEAWRYEYEAAAVTGPSARHPGPRSSPAVADGKVVVVGASGILSCVDVATHKEAWHKDPFPNVVPQYFVGSSPIIVDGMAIAHLGGRGNGAIIAYNLASGDEKWRWPGEGPAYASPVLATIDGVKQIVTITEKSVVGVAVADGKLLWQLPFPVQGLAYNAATPIVDGQTVIYTGQGRGTKAVKIEKKGDAFAATDLWSDGDQSPQFSTPVLKDGLLFGQSQQGNLYCIDAKAGKTAWAETTGGRSAYGAIVDLGPCLMVLPEKGELTVYKADAAAYSEITKYKVADTVYAYPVVSGNRILVKDLDSIALWTIE
jgi:outer membrane protein assembly factor BamB